MFPAAGLLPEAAEKARTVIVNGEPTLMDSVADVVPRGSSSEVLRQLVRRVVSYPFRNFLTALRIF